MPILEPLRRQLEEGRALALEEPASPGRRGFIIVRPLGGHLIMRDSLSAARSTGHIDRATGFLVQRVEYDAAWLDTNDYDQGMITRARSDVATVEQVESVLEEWGIAPEDLRPYHQTDAP
ncbi:MAG: hypothetical protein JO246_16230 [Frankiaceae bacterium]|nr:hypothetical protein [Frankiaceae bacterium]